MTNITAAARTWRSESHQPKSSGQRMFPHVTVDPTGGEAPDGTVVTCNGPNPRRHRTGLSPRPPTSGAPDDVEVGVELLDC